MKTIASLLALAAALPVAAADVDVRFRAPETFRDAGRSAAERQRSTEAIAAAFRSLGAALPKGQVLRVDVTDLDLAGTLKLTAHGDLRVLRGGADRPRIDFTWVLEGDGRVLRQGSESLADPDYPSRPAPRGDASTLPHERRMLERWFAQRFDAPSPP